MRGGVSTRDRLLVADVQRDAGQAVAAGIRTGSFLGFRVCLPGPKETGGSAVLVSSVHALVGLPGRPACAAGKAGLTGLTRQLAVEYGPDVRVNAIPPGPVLTPARDGVGAADREKPAGQTAARRLGRPEEVASAIAFLLTEDASFVTGACSSSTAAGAC